MGVVSRKGVALVTVLILSAIALIFTAVMLYLVSSGVRITGVEVRYTTSLEVAKGVSNYLIELIDQDKLCDYTNCNAPNSPIELGDYKKLDKYKVQATLLSRVEDPSTGSQVYAIEVKVLNEVNPKEKATIDFVYEIE